MPVSNSTTSDLSYTVNTGGTTVPVMLPPEYEILYPSGITLRLKGTVTPEFLKVLIQPLINGMFNLNDSMRYYLYSYPTDMRKSFYTLSGVVKDLMGHDVRNGDVFIFVGRTCSSMKILHMECGGLVIYHLRLEEGQFRLPVFDEQTHTYKIT